jgi:Fur family ferric uptake transcriptional regulator
MGSSKNPNQRSIESLRKAGLSITPSRIAILNLLGKEHRVWSIEQIQAALEKSKSVNRQGSLVFTTLYRCLIKLEEAGLVSRTEIGDGISRFELNDPDHLHHHHHVICKKCQSIKPLKDCGIIELEATLKGLGYTEVSHRLEFFGVCKACQ